MCHIYSPLASRRLCIRVHEIMAEHVTWSTMAEAKSWWPVIRPPAISLNTATCAHKLITLFTRIHQWASPEPVRLNPHPPTLHLWRSILTSSFHPHLGLLTCLFPLGLPNLSLLSCVLLHPNNNWRRIQTLTLMIMQLYPSSSYFISLAIQRLFLFWLLLTIYVNPSITDPIGCSGLACQTWTQDNFRHMTVPVNIWLCNETSIFISRPPNRSSPCHFFSKAAFLCIFLLLYRCICVWFCIHGVLPVVDKAFGICRGVLQIYHQIDGDSINVCDNWWFVRGKLCCILPAGPDLRRYIGMVAVRPPQNRNGICEFSWDICFSLKSRKVSLYYSLFLW
jgi:hypothetical protein